MLRFKKSKGKGGEGKLVDADGKAVFEFNKTVEHGFPNKPSAIAYDPKLELLAIGTNSGYLKIFGQPGVELSANHSEVTRIQELHFLPEQGRVISICDTGEQNSIHLWEINKKDGASILEEVKTCTLEGRLKKISVCCLSMKGNCLYLGTEGGNIYLLDLNSFELQDFVIYQDVVMQSVQDDNKGSAGSVEAVKENPHDPNNLLICYKKGLIVLWNNETISVVDTFPTSIDLESVYWHADGNKFICAHADGSLTTVTIIKNEENIRETSQETSTPFGPFPCKAITKVEWPGSLVIFSGGMPRASYGDRNCVSIMQSTTTQVVFDFTSRVIDFFTLTDDDGEPASLAVLCEEEFVLIDLKTTGYPTFTKPYLACLHSSAITCAQHYSDCPEELWNTLVAAGKEQRGADVTDMSWPFSGGRSLVEAAGPKDLLVTGHQDGNVQFWDVSDAKMNLLYVLESKKFFVSEHEGGDNGGHDADEEGWPPFKKVGCFDPFTDDDRLSVHKLALCVLSKTLVVAGAGGQVVLFDLCTEESSVEIETADVNLVEGIENFDWKGLGPMTVKDGTLTVGPGFRPRSVIQMTPAAPITAIALHTEWSLLAAGTGFGFVLYDYLRKKVVLMKCTASANQQHDSGAKMSRVQSLKRSIRNTFRRKKKAAEAKAEETPKKEGEEGAAGGSAPASPTVKSPPVSRLVDENRVEETLQSMIRCLYFADTFLRDGVHHTPTLWAGANSAHLYVCSITLPEVEKRADEDVQAEMWKDIKLKHKAPVVGIFVADKNGTPLPGAYEVDYGAQAPDMTGQHGLIICSEEQFKGFALPTMKSKHKVKFTAIDGSRIRKVGLVSTKTSDDKVVNCIASLSNMGNVYVHSIPQLKEQVNQNCTRKEDVVGITSLVFGKNGQGLYMNSTSSVQRFALTAGYSNLAQCVIDLPEGMRPVEEEPAQEEEATPAEAEEGAVAIVVETEEKGEAEGGEAAEEGEKEEETKEEAAEEKEETEEKEEAKDEEKEETAEDAAAGKVVTVTTTEVTNTDDDGGSTRHEQRVEKREETMTEVMESEEGSVVVTSTTVTETMVITHEQETEEKTFTKILTKDGEVIDITEEVQMNGEQEAEEEPTAEVAEESVPVETVPQEIVPEETVPVETVPQESVPEVIVPTESVPEETVPEETAPEEMVPEDPIPQESVPEVIVPTESAPVETVPEESVPEETVPEDPTPQETVPEVIAPTESVPVETVPEESVPEETVPEDPTPQESVPEIIVPTVSISEESAPEESVPEDPISEEPVPEEPAPAESVLEEVPSAESVPVESEDFHENGAEASHEDAAEIDEAADENDAGEAPEHHKKGKAFKTPGKLFGKKKSYDPQEAEKAAAE